MPHVTLKVPYRITHYRDDVVVGVDVIVATVRYAPGRPGSWYKRNGDPGDPPDPSEVEVVAITFADGCVAWPEDELGRYADLLHDDEKFYEACDKAYADYMEASHE
jgi:hypothetical protein